MRSFDTTDDIVSSNGLSGFEAAAQGVAI